MAWRWAAGFGKLWILAGAEGHVNLGFSGWIMGVLVLGLVQMECSLVTLSHGEKTKSFLCTSVGKDSRYPPLALRRAFRSPLSPSAPLSRDAVESVKAPSSPAAKLQGKIANEYSNTALI